MGRSFDQTNSHYLNEKNRIIPTDPKDEWDIMDADYNIMEGCTFGTCEEDTLERQGWKGA